MSGWKSKVAGVGAMLTGLGMMIVGVLKDTIDMDAIKTGWEMLLGGLAVLGIAHKVEKAGTP